jgi:hypothetical protein
MAVTARTRIKPGDLTITLQDLTRHMNKTISVKTDTLVPRKSIKR